MAIDWGGLLKTVGNTAAKYAPEIATVGSALLGAKANKSGTKQVETQSLPAWQTDALMQILGQTQDLAAQGGQQYFPGDPVAQFNPVQLQAMQEMLQSGNDIGYQTDAMQSANNFFLDPNTMYNPNSIPGVAAQREAMIRDTGRMLSESWMPTERGDAIASGQFGGSRQAIGEALLADRAADTLSKNLGQFDSNIFQMMLGANQNAMNRIPEINQQMMLPGTIQGQVGGVMEGKEQQNINSDKAKWDFYQNQPYFLLDQLRQSAGVNAGQTNSAQVTGSGALGALGGAATAIGMWPQVKDIFTKPGQTAQPTQPVNVSPDIYAPPTNRP